MIEAASTESTASQSNDELVSQLKTFSFVLVTLVILLALVVLAGWRFDVESLKSLVPNLLPMKANAAICFLFAGVSLVLILRNGRAKWTYYIRQGLAAAVILIGLVTLGEYVSSSGLGIDQLLFKIEAEVTGISNTGRMAPNTAFNFILLGAGLLIIGAKSARDFRPAQLLALVIVLFAAVAWMGYATGAQSFEGISSYTRMAVPTTIAFILIGLALLCARSDSGFMAVLTGDNAGSVAARRLLPAALGIPLVLVWLKAVGEDAGLYDYDVGTWLLVLISLIVFALLIWITIKPLERADRKLKAAALELERSNSELENFAYIASHDLKQPLRKIAGFTHLLSDQYRGKLDKDADELIDYTVDSASRMQDLVDDLLAYSRVNTDEKPFVEADSGEICDTAIENLMVSIDESGAKVDHGAMPHVIADPIQLEQLFQNLIGNAIKFHGDNTPRVHIDAERSNGRWIFSVHDNGIGIDPQYEERIFEIFKRLNTKTEYSGTGLGLAICKKIVDRHKGDIWLESKLDKGSTFYFTFAASEEGA